MAKFGVRRNWVNAAASRAASWTTWTPLAPVPITATRLPVKSIPSCGHSAVWCKRPSNKSSCRPGIGGMYGFEANPRQGTR